MHFVGLSTKLVDSSVHYLCDFVHEHHHASLQHLSGVSEISDVAESEDGHDLLSRNHGVDLSSLPHILCNDLRACLTEPDCQKSSDLDD